MQFYKIDNIYLKKEEIRFESDRADAVFIYYEKNVFVYTSKNENMHKNSWKHIRKKALWRQRTLL